MTTAIEVDIDPALHEDFREVLRNVNKQASVAHLVAYVWQAAVTAETRRAADAAPELKCKGCGGTIAQHGKGLRCRCDHTRFCAEYPNCNPQCPLSRVEASERMHALARRLLESADSSCEQWEDYRASALFRILDEVQFPSRPVGWRVRGYSQFRTGTPTEWRYVDGPERPIVSDAANCDIEPLYR